MIRSPFRHALTFALLFAGLALSPRLGHAQQLKWYEAGDQPIGHIPHLFFKASAISPVWNNLAFEVEFNYWEHWSVVFDFGFTRTQEDLLRLPEYGCFRQVGYGTALGFKYYFYQETYGRRNVEGFGLKALMNFNLRNDREDLCESSEAYPLRRGPEFGPTFQFCWQRSLLGRLLIEPQFGLGFTWARYELFEERFLVPQPGEVERRFSLSFPIGLNVGLVF